MTNAEMKTKIFKTAWELARHGKNVFGGKASDYIASALTIKWAEYQAKASKQADEAAAVEDEIATRRANFKTTLNNRDSKNVTATLVRIADKFETEYGCYYNFVFETESGERLVWHTLYKSYKGATTAKLHEGNVYSISFNRKGHDRYTDDEMISYVTVA